MNKLKQGWMTPLFHDMCIKALALDELYFDKNTEIQMTVKTAIYILKIRMTALQSLIE